MGLGPRETREREKVEGECGHKLAATHAESLAACHRSALKTRRMSISPIRGVRLYTEPRTESVDAASRDHVSTSSFRPEFSSDLTDFSPRP